MLITRRTFAWVLTAAVLVVGPASARAQPAGAATQGATSARAPLVAERQRLRAELERVNAEIDALKHSGRGMREDYRLRERLADAEALARRLTELDARLGANAGATSALPATGAEPRVAPGDGPAELDAKADILADQARRLAARGDVLIGRAHDLEARQTLRRRVGQMEHDPFSPLEGSKRRVMAGGAGGALSVASPPTKVVTPAAPPPSQTAVGETAGQQPAAGGVGAGAGASLAPGRDTPSLGTSNTALGTPGGVAVSSPTTAPTPTSGASDSTALSVQLRDLLDSTTLAEIQHLEAAGGPGASTDALERAGAALKARAERLRQQAAALRASEHPRAR